MTTRDPDCVRVLRTIRSHSPKGATWDDLGLQVDIDRERYPSPGTLQAMWELRKAGYIQPRAGTDPPPQAGPKAEWVITDAGRRFLEAVAPVAKRDAQRQAVAS